MPPYPRRINIIVELPSGKRCVHGVSEVSLTRLDRPQPLFPFFQTDLRRGVREAENQKEEHDLCWLKELYSKIWGRNNLIPTLIPRVEVT